MQINSDKNFSLTESILQILEYKKITKYKFCKDLGLSKGFLDKPREITTDKYANILAYFPEINPDWLLTGKGEMLKQEVKIINNSVYDTNIDEQEINLYDINAAGNLQTLFESGKQSVIGKIRIPNLPKCDGAIYLRGDSMYPLLKSGDIIIYKILNGVSNITFGEMYLIDYAIDGDDYLVVKYINASEIENHIRIVSYNPHFSPMDIPLSSIRSLALVKASVRINTLI